MRSFFLLLAASAMVAACSDSSSSSTSSSGGGSSGSSSGSSGSSSGSSGSSGGSDEPAFDACTVLTQTEAQDVMAYELTPCRKEPTSDAVRHVWESPASAPLAAIGSVNVTVEKIGKSFDAVKILCGGTNAGCITLSGVGTSAVLNLKYTTVYVQKGEAIFAAQCENPGQISAGEDATIQSQLTTEGKEADLSVRSDGSLWRNSSSCSLAIAKIIAGKLP
jgi:hypothetical protein